MKIGFSLPQFGGQALQAALIPAYARELEEAGADSLWVGDRLIAPANPTIGYSGTDTIPAYFNSSLDPFVTLTLAAHTSSGGLNKMNPKTPLHMSNILASP